ncbi:hypothetical protein ENHAE0001_2175 [Enhydrobacter aerosaccus SK60]|nr:hypothetical protein ENHAE0001_2175 [Enhydrobacter aerosaccus SK60]
MATLSASVVKVCWALNFDVVKKISIENIATDFFSLFFLSQT